LQVGASGRGLSGRGLSERGPSGRGPSGREPSGRGLSGRGRGGMQNADCDMLHVVGWTGWCHTVTHCREALPITAVE
jgi:hypothetical protein